ncbi:hypothetical protein [Alloyangia pacifica]|uniref:Uncharacterized protein n=1 Tax=Alloyangia pacifica TaxID=311180 RepID=A0A1I6TGS2_9RHOB|nr:hypothetical protein [Alloyangia pacifica]SDH18518.1 hypothetical protein SAMN04488245_106325 [Alloyangia pacifica]SFS88422.1 hypothetical protein SAMN04488050_10667 [Alloyangia pacifica]
MVFMTPFDWAVLMLRGTSQMLAVQTQMTEALLTYGRKQGAALPTAGATVLPFVRPAPVATLGICGPVRMK